MSIGGSVRPTAEPVAWLGAVAAADGGAGEASVEVLLAEFGAWLAAERVLSGVTVRCYGKQACTFLAHLPEPLAAALQHLDAGQVTSFMLEFCRDRNVWSAKAAVTAVQALLLFLHVAEYVPVELAAAVPAVAGWRLSSLPPLPRPRIQLEIAHPQGAFMLGVAAPHQRSNPGQQLLHGEPPAWQPKPAGGVAASSGAPHQT